MTDGEIAARRHENRALEDRYRAAQSRALGLASALTKMTRPLPLDECGMAQVSVPPDVIAGLAAALVEVDARADEWGAFLNRRR